MGRYRMGKETTTAAGFDLTLLDAECMQWQGRMLAACQCHAASVIDDPLANVQRELAVVLALQHTILRVQDLTSVIEDHVFTTALVRV
jgi:hypothetical protein